MMKGKKIVLGITGSIAAYKAAVLTRGLIKKGAEVADCDYAGRKGVHYADYAFGADQQAGHQ